jgi:transposase
MRRYALRDDQWDRIKDFLPGREGHVGGTAAERVNDFGTPGVISLVSKRV